MPAMLRSTVPVGVQLRRRNAAQRLAGSAQRTHPGRCRTVVAAARGTDREPPPVWTPQPQQPQPKPQQAGPISPVRRRAVLGGLAAFTICSCCSAAEQGGGGPWRYGPQKGQEQWPGLCAAGSAQSPVDIPAERVAAALERPAAGALKFDYRALKGTTVLNSGHGAQVNMAPGNIMEVYGQKYQMVQYHFHSPSEHAFSGKHADMELHLVHKNLDTGAIAVVGILLETGPGANCRTQCVALQQAMFLIPAAVGSVSAPHELAPDTFTSLLPGSGDDTGASYPHPYVQYAGSLTTPPCSEGLNWYVLLESKPVSAAQVLRFQRLLGGGAILDMNSRVKQPLNGRGFDYETADAFATGQNKKAAAA